MWPSWKYEIYRVVGEVGLTKGVSIADHVAISDLLGRYCWHVDNGHAEEWADLWTEDGVYSGSKPEPVVGREALKAVPRGSFEGSNGGKTRHLIANLYCDYIDNNDVIRARYYNFVSNWETQGRCVVMALCEVILVRGDSGWKIKRSDVELLPGRPGV
jgi:bifunctional aromatase (cyclase/dehydratase)